MVDVTVIVDDDADYHEVMDRAAGVGMVGIERLDLLGIAYGHVREADMPTLRVLQGIREIRIADEVMPLPRRGIPGWMRALGSRKRV